MKNPKKMKKTSIKERSEHYYTEKPQSKLRIYEIEVSARGQSLKLFTASGIFSYRKLDKGTELLINKSIIHPKWKILDLGCGYGAVGITLKKAFPTIDAVFSDVNERAVGITRKNLKKLKIKGEAVKSNVFDNIKDKDFDAILLNPPQTAGKKICFKMIEDSIGHLKKEGLLQVVARHNKGGKELSRKMEEVFGNVRGIAKKAGYRIYLSEKG